MHKVINSAYILFLSGFLLKFLHIPFNAIIMLSAILLLIIFLTVQLFNREKHLPSILAGYVTALWLATLLSAVKFFPVVEILFPATLIISVALLLFILKKRTTSNRLPVLFISAIITLVFFYTPSDDRYYIMNIKWNIERETDFRSWDKYSWFLYQNGDFYRAEQVSYHALQIAIENQDQKWATFITGHYQKIRDRNWDEYSSH